MTIKTLIEANPSISLRKLSIACNISYGVLLKASKQPIANVPYDPDSTNYDALQAKLDARKIDLDSINIEELLTEARSKATTSNEIQINTLWKLRGTETIWQIVAQTESHVCIEGFDAGLNQNVLRAMSIATFLHQTPKQITNEPIEENA